MNRLFMGGLLAAALIMPGPASARPVEVFEVTYKGVTGTTVNALIRSLNRQRTGGSWAYTSWRVSRNAGCETVLVIRQTLPKWLDRRRAPTSVQAKWDRFYAALLAHEAEHVAFGRDAAAELDALGCSADIGRVLRKWLTLERAFDRRTRHGMATGATLRPTR